MCDAHDSCGSDGPLRGLRPAARKRGPAGSLTQVLKRFAALPGVVTAVMLAMCSCADDRGAQHRAVPAGGGETEPAASRPFFNTRSHRVEYAGPGREDPEPNDVDQIRIGWFGPSDPEHPTTGPMWSAAVMSLEEANRTGGRGGIPFRLVPAWSANPWGTGVKQVTLLAYKERVWALVGSPDGPSAHLVEQIVAKARLPFVNPVSTDKTTNLVNVPWIFSCAPGDHLLTPVLAKAIVSRSAEKGFLLVSCTDHDSRLTTAELLASMRRLDGYPKRHLELTPGASGFSAHLQSVRDARPAAVVVIAGPRDSARFVMALGRAGLDLPVFGGPAMGRSAFVRDAGPFAEGVTFPLLWDPTGAGRGIEEFTQRYTERVGIEPDYTAAYTYDAMNLLVAAVRKASLNRARIRDAIRELSPWPGVTGTITWDPAGHNERPVTLGTIRDGRPVSIGTTSVK